MKTWIKIGCMVVTALPLFCFGADSAKTENWKNISSGKMTVASDAKTNSVKFTVEFPNAEKDRWAYPLLKIDEADRNASKLTFEIKVETSPKQEQYKSLIIISQPIDKDAKKIHLPYSLPISDDFETVTVDLNGSLAYAKGVQIGLNFMDADQATFSIRNVKFEK